MKEILLIDDDPLQLTTREAVLRRAGFNVHVATTAVGAMALLRAPVSDRIGAIVTDHIMPEVSGVEFVKMLREVKPDMPVIVVSGLAEAEDEYAGFNVTFRQKPCPPDELIRTVKSVTGHP